VRTSGGRPIIGAAILAAGATLLVCGLRTSDSPPQPAARVLQDNPLAAKAHALAPSPPIRIEIPAIGLAAPILKLGLRPDGTMDVPSLRNVGAAGWFEESPTPGERGASVIVGHVDSETAPGAFYQLGELVPGQVIRIARKDDSAPAFRIHRVERVAKSTFPSQRVYGAAKAPVLRLITCGGTYDKKARHYTENIIVYASLLPR
jgi:sortase (surface protein transpeptidase)